MRKHLRLIVLVTLLALALSPLSSFASGSCDMCGYEYDGSTCNTICGGAGVSSSSSSTSSTESSDPGPDPIYQHAANCPCNDCESSRAMTFAEKMTNLLKGTEQMRAAYYFLLDQFGNEKSVPYIENPEHIPFN